MGAAGGAAGRPAAIRGAGRPSPGLAGLLDEIYGYDGPEPFGSAVAAGLLTAAGLRVTPRTVTSWATRRQLSGLLVARSLGWQFTRDDLAAFVTRRYHAAMR